MSKLLKSHFFQLLAAVLMTIIITYAVTQKRNTIQQQLAGSQLAVAAIETSFNDEVIKLQEQANTLLIQCINNYASCDRSKVARDIAAINSKRYAILKQEQVNVAKLKTLLHQ